MYVSYKGHRGATSNDLVERRQYGLFHGFVVANANLIMVILNTVPYKIYK